MHHETKECLKEGIALCPKLDEKNQINNMCTVTLSYNQNSALARRKLAALLSSGLFIRLTEPVPADEASLQEHRETRDAFLETSKRSMSHIIAKHL